MPKENNKSRELERKENQFCDCYDHDFRVAVRKLSQIIDTQIVNDSIKLTASMYVKTSNEIDVQRYIKNLKDRLEEYDELLYAVASKYPNETRHETALRYIREAEAKGGGEVMACDVTKE